jgi:hypothetical protein
MKKRESKKKSLSLDAVTRREFVKTVAYGTVLYSTAGLAEEESVPPEPASLDEPTEWKEGDPPPQKMKVPGVEPEQKSMEAPPSQPMDDDRGKQPSGEHKWVYGYWLWGSGAYVWVPGYWAVPPKAEYDYEPGYWTYQDPTWIYIRGGWVVTGTTTVVVYASPRTVRTVYVFRAPIRIIRRHRRWRRYRARRHHHSAHRRSTHHRHRSGGSRSGGSRGVRVRRR